jgi:hypothetical protein
MPRTARAAVDGYCYHVLNRRARVFHGDDNYGAFCRLMCQATARVPLRVLGYCLMKTCWRRWLRRGWTWTTCSKPGGVPCVSAWTGSSEAGASCWSGATPAGTA